MKRLSLLVCLVVAACHQQADPTPSGADTLSCTIEGKQFTPYLAPILLTTRKALQANRTGRQGAFVVQAKDSFNEVLIYVVATQGPGTYPLGYARNPLPYQSNPSSYASYISIPPLQPGADPYNLPPPAVYYTDAITTGSVTVSRLDTIAHVVTGTFEYTAREAATNRLVRISGGKFDVALP